MKEIVLILSLVIFTFSIISKEKPLIKRCNALIHGAEVAYEVYEMMEECERFDRMRDIRDRIESNENCTWGEYCEYIEEQNRFCR